MHNTLLFSNIQNSLKAIFDLYPNLVSIINKIDEKNGITYLVGGAVRDIVLGHKVADMDIEVHGLELEVLSNILSNFGVVNLVGKSFGVIKMYGIPIDWSLPRTDMSGRKPYVYINPSMAIEDALRRRDLTMNAMAINLKTFEFIDPFGGLEDIKNKVLRSPDVSFFTQDPLRFYRVMQFTARFQMHSDKDLTDVCQKMNIKNISIERIEAEFEKMMLKSKCPSLGLRWIKSIGRLHEILPELDQTIEVEQDLKWHPEKYVFEHLMQSLDAAAKLSYSNFYEKLIVTYASLCHDLGKVTTTKIVDGHIKSPGHAEESVSLARKMLRRITKKKDLINSVVILIRYHMLPSQFISLNSSLAAYRRLALKLKGYANLKMLAKLAIADRQGRNGSSSEPLTTHIDFVDEFIARANKAEVFKEPQKPILHGRDILDVVKPGPLMGELLKYAYELQLKKGIKDKQVLRELTIKKFKTSLQ